MQWWLYPYYTTPRAIVSAGDSKAHARGLLHSTTEVATGHREEQFLFQENERERKRTLDKRYWWTTFCLEIWVVHIQTKAHNALRTEHRNTVEEWCVWPKLSAKRRYGIRLIDTSSHVSRTNYSAWNQGWIKKFSCNLPTSDRSLIFPLQVTI